MSEGGTGSSSLPPAQCQHHPLLQRGAQHPQEAAAVSCKLQSSTTPLRRSGATLQWLQQLMVWRQQDTAEYARYRQSAYFQHRWRTAVMRTQVCFAAIHLALAIKSLLLDASSVAWIWLAIICGIQNAVPIALLWGGLDNQWLPHLCATSYAVFSLWIWVVAKFFPFPAALVPVLGYHMELLADAPNTICCQLPPRAMLVLHALRAAVVNVLVRNMPAAGSAQTAAAHAWLRFMKNWLGFLAMSVALDYYNFSLYRTHMRRQQAQQQQQQEEEEVAQPAPGAAKAALQQSSKLASAGISAVPSSSHSISSQQDRPPSPRHAVAIPQQLCCAGPGSQHSSSVSPAAELAAKQGACTAAVVAAVAAASSSVTTTSQDVLYPMPSLETQQDLSDFAISTCSSNMPALRQAQLSAAAARLLVHKCLAGNYTSRLSNHRVQIHMKLRGMSPEDMPSDLVPALQQQVFARYPHMQLMNTQMRRGCVVLSLDVWQLHHLVQQEAQYAMAHERIAATGRCSMHLDSEPPPSDAMGRAGSMLDGCLAQLLCGTDAAADAGGAEEQSTSSGMVHVACALQAAVLPIIQGLPASSALKHATTMTVQVSSAELTDSAMWAWSWNARAATYTPVQLLNVPDSPPVAEAKEHIVADGTADTVDLSGESYSAPLSALKLRAVPDAAVGSQQQLGDSLLPAARLSAAGFTQSTAFRHAVSNVDEPVHWSSAKQVPAHIPVPLCSMHATAASSVCVLPAAQQQSSTLATVTVELAVNVPAHAHICGWEPQPAGGTSTSSTAPSAGSGSTIPGATTTHKLLARCQSSFLPVTVVEVPSSSSEISTADDIAAEELPGKQLKGAARTCKASVQLPATALPGTMMLELWDVTGAAAATIPTPAAAKPAEVQVAALPVLLLPASWGDAVQEELVQHLSSCSVDPSSVAAAVGGSEHTAPDTAGDAHAGWVGADMLPLLMDIGAWLQHQPAHNNSSSGSAGQDSEARDSTMQPSAQAGAGADPHVQAVMWDVARDLLRWAVQQGMSALAQQLMQGLQLCQRHHQQQQHLQQQQHQQQQQQEEQEHDLGEEQQQQQQLRTFRLRTLLNWLSGALDANVTSSTTCSNASSNAVVAVLQECDGGSSEDQANSLLHLAMLGSNPDMLMQVIRWGCLPDGSQHWVHPDHWTAANQLGFTPLHVAAAQPCCMQLLEAVQAAGGSALGQVVQQAWEQAQGGLSITPAELYQARQTTRANSDAMELEEFVAPVPSSSSTTHSPSQQEPSPDASSSTAVNSEGRDAGPVGTISTVEPGSSNGSSSGSGGDSGSGNAIVTTTTWRTRLMEHWAALLAAWAIGCAQLHSVSLQACRYVVAQYRADAAFQAWYRRQGRGSAGTLASALLFLVVMALLKGWSYERRVVFLDLAALAPMFLACLGALLSTSKHKQDVDSSWQAWFVAVTVSRIVASSAPSLGVVSPVFREAARTLTHAAYELLFAVTEQAPPMLTLLGRIGLTISWSIMYRASGVSNAWLRSITLNTVCLLCSMVSGVLHRWVYQRMLHQQNSFARNVAYDQSMCDQ